MNDIIFGIALVPLIIGLVQVFKGVGLPDRWAPVASLVFGVLAGVAIGSQTGLAPLEGVVTGIAFGLSASGLYSGTRALAA